MSAWLSVGVALAKVLLRAHGRPDTADALDDTASAFHEAVNRFKGRQSPATRLGKQLATKLDEAFLESEFRDISAEDRQAVENQLADFLGSALDDPQRFVEAAVNPERLEHYLQQHGGSRLKDSLGGTAGDLFDFLLGEAVLQVSRLAPSSPQFDSTALTNLLRSAEEWDSKLDELLSRPGSRGILAKDARYNRAALESFAPPALKDREAELAELADWARRGTGGWFGYQAKAKAGKTALLASFALHPPAGVECVSHFIRINYADTRTRDGFLGNVLAQLAGLAGRDQVPSPDRDAQAKAVLASLLEEAALACLAREKPTRLALVLDGLDEDACYSDPNQLTGSIVGLLPATLPSGVTFIVARRTNPPLPKDLPQVGSGARHPLEDAATWHRLAPSPHAEAAFSADDVRGFMVTPVGEDVAAFLATVGTSLSPRELLGLVSEKHPEATLASVETQLQQAAARIFDVAIRDRTPSYQFSHDLLTQEVVERLDQAGRARPDSDDRAGWDRYRRIVLAHWRQRIIAQAHSYRNKGWPQETPDYLLGNAPLALVQAGTEDDSGKVSDLVDLATDESRIEAIRDRYLSATRALHQIREVIGWLIERLLSTPDHGFYHLARLILAEHSLSRQANAVPPELPAAFAKLGEVGLAFDLAAGLDDVLTRVTALTAIAKAVAAADGSKIEEALGEALTIADSIPTKTSRAKALTHIATTYAALGNPTKALAIADTIPNDAIILTSTIPYLARIEALTQIAAATAALGNLTKALAIADTIPNERARVEALTHIATTYATLNNPTQAAQILTKAQTIADTIPNNWARAKALTHIATTYATLNNPTQAAQILTKALAIADIVPHERARVEALTHIATTYATLGNPTKALAIADTIPNNQARAKALTHIAAATAALGNPIKALAIADTIPNNWARAEALAHIATTYATLNNPDKAAQILTQAHTTADTISDDLGRAEVLTQIATTYATLNNPDKAAQILTQAHTTAANIPYDLDRTQALTQIATTTATLGKLGRALDVVELVLSKSPDRRRYAASYKEVMLLKARILLKLDRRSEATTTLGQLWQEQQSIYPGWDVLIALDPDGASRITDELLTKDQ